jgi:hypothetical protein
MACGIFNPYDIESVLKSILESLDFDLQINCMIFTDLCQLVLIHKFFGLINFLENMKKTFTSKKGVYYSIIDTELSTLIMALKSLNEAYKRTMKTINTVPIKASSQANRRKNSNKKIIPKINIGPMNKFIKNDINDNSREENADAMNKISKKNNNLIPKLKAANRYYENSQEERSRFDEYHSDDMNEISKSFIDLNYYNNQIPLRCSRNLNNNMKQQQANNNESLFGESCNVVDSSYSMIKHEDYNRQYSMYDKSKNESRVYDKDGHYVIINPKNIETSFIEFEN